MKTSMRSSRSESDGCGSLVFVSGLQTIRHHSCRISYDSILGAHLEPSRNLAAERVRRLRCPVLLLDHGLGMDGVEGLREARDRADGLAGLAPAALLRHRLAQFELVELLPQLACQHLASTVDSTRPESKRARDPSDPSGRCERRTWLVVKGLGVLGGITARARVSVIERIDCGSREFRCLRSPSSERKRVGSAGRVNLPAPLDELPRSTRSSASSHEHDTLDTAGDFTSARAARR